ncbi:DUF5711 family protein [Fusibacter sp. 3D3]|uniref:DUF5711 family protein n=1 Tax=Fusibacter sp. 3D3 TaxID=1048380 RepID=UPI000853C58A|nr:DUF5711 family protein [Fusibacter sp. 3D3]GAU77858.1 hypothetical protein F3D3_2487 [Fusibacter sp. 3D3]
MNKSRLNSLIIFVICLIIVLKFDFVVAQFSKWVKEDFKVINRVIYNQNVDFENRAEILKVASRYVILDQSKLKVYDDEGIPIWEKEVATQNVLMASGKSSIALVEKKSGDVFIVDMKGNIKASHFGFGSVKGLKYFDEQYVGLLKTDGTLTILDEKLEVLSNTVLPKGEIIDFSINIKRQDIVAVVLDLSRKDFNTKLVIATFNGEIISGSNLFSEIAYQLWLSDDQINVITDSQMMAYDYECNLRFSVPFDRTVRKVLYEPEKGQFYFNVVNENGQIENPKAQNAIMVINNVGETHIEFDAGMDNIEGLKIMDKRLMAFNHEKIIFFNEEGKMVDTYIGKDEILDVIILDDTHFGIAYINHMDLYILK